MSVLTAFFDKENQGIVNRSVRTKGRLGISIKRAGEIFWGATSFALFLALGPFSAIAVVFSLASLVSAQEGRVEPEPVA